MAPGSRAARWTRFSLAPDRRWWGPARTCSSASARPPLSRSTRPAGECAASGAPGGAPSLRGRPSSGSPPDRHEREAIALLGGDFEGIVGSDRRWAYRGFDPTPRQVCWSHLIRDLSAHSEGLAAQKRFGETGLEIAGRLFAAWDGFGEHGDRHRLRREVAPLKRELKALLESGSVGRPNKLTWGFSKNLLKVFPALWNLTEVEGMEPANNVAERARRGPLIHRKLSLGSQSERGERTVERLRSASVTCRLQGRSVFTYLADTLSARVRGDPAPLLA